MQFAIPQLKFTAQSNKTMDKDKILTPMNHREIDYMAQKLSGCNIPDAFSCAEILTWLDETGRRVFDDDLIMDYGTDCLRLYLMFETTPKADDAPFYESWQESALEGIYKFLARYRRLILAAAYWDECGGYVSADDEQMNIAISHAKLSIDETKNKIEKYISRGNTLPNRHNIISALMELQKTLQNKLKINEIISMLHSHAIEKAVPHSEARQCAVNPSHIQITSAVNADSGVLKICKDYICLLAQFAPNISKTLWEEIS